MALLTVARRQRVRERNRADNLNITIVSDHFLGQEPVYTDANPFCFTTVSALHSKVVAIFLFLQYKLLLSLITPYFVERCNHFYIPSGKCCNDLHIFKSCYNNIRSGPDSSSVAELLDRRIQKSSIE